MTENPSSPQTKRELLIPKLEFESEIVRKIKKSVDLFGSKTNLMVHINDARRAGLQILT